MPASRSPAARNSSARASIFAVRDEVAGHFIRAGDKIGEKHAVAF